MMCPVSGASLGIASAASRSADPVAGVTIALMIRPCRFAVSRWPCSTAWLHSRTTWYQVQFHPGPTAERESGKQSPTAMTRFAVAAVPTDPMTSRRRAFCADDWGTIYVTTSGTGPVDIGRCLDTSSPLR